MTTTQSPKLRAMVDANILIAGSGWPRFPYAVLQHAVLGDFTLVLAPVVIEEARRHIRILIPEALDRFEEVLQASGYELVTDPSSEEIKAHANLVRDAKDIPVAVAAIAVQVDYLITQDKDFTDHDESTAELHRRLNVILPGTFLRERMGWTSEALEAIRHRTWQDLDG